MGLHGFGGTRIAEHPVPADGVFDLRPEVTCLLVFFFSDLAEQPLRARHDQDARQWKNPLSLAFHHHSPVEGRASQIAEAKEGKSAHTHRNATDGQREREEKSYLNRP